MIALLGGDSHFRSRRPLDVTQEDSPITDARESALSNLELQDSATFSKQTHTAANERKPDRVTRPCVGPTRGTQPAACSWQAWPHARSFRDDLAAWDPARFFRETPPAWG